MFPFPLQALEFGFRSLSPDSDAMDYSALLKRVLSYVTSHHYHFPPLSLPTLVSSHPCLSPPLSLPTLFSSHPCLFLPFLFLCSHLAFSSTLSLLLNTFAVGIPSFTLHNQHYLQPSHSALFPILTFSTISTPHIQQYLHPSHSALYLHPPHSALSPSSTFSTISTPHIQQYLHPSHSALYLHPPHSALSPSSTFSTISTLHI